MRYLILTAFLTMIFAPPSARGAVVWRIGKFDESSAEFKPAVNYPDSAADPVFVVGKSSPEQDWVAYQPGSSNGKAGFRRHPFTIRFDLPDTPTGVYNFVIATLVEAPRIPSLEVNLNGHGGLFYIRPKLNYSAGDSPGLSQAMYSTYTLRFRVPKRFLQQGQNTVVLTAIDQPDVRDDSEDGPMLGNGGIVYDALELNQELTSADEFPEVTCDVEPTVFYKWRAKSLVETLRVIVRFNEQVSAGEARLKLQGRRAVRKLSTEHEFGEQRLDFEVPEFTGTQTADVAISSGGHEFAFRSNLAPGKKWTIFVIPHEHLDVGYSDYSSKVAEVQSRAIDKALEILETHPEFKFSLDGYWVAQQFELGRGPTDWQRFTKAVAEQRIFVPAQYANVLTGFASLEALIRSLLPSHRLYQKYGGAFDYANITDVPSYSWSYASVLAASGVKNFLAASNNYRAPVLLRSRLHERSPFWWEGPDGGRVLMWYARSYAQAESLFALPPKVAEGEDSLPTFLQCFAGPDYKSDAVVVFGTQSENSDLVSSQADLVRQWNERYAYPRLRFAGVSEALRYIVHQAGESLAVVRGDGGPYWEDGLGADAASTALARQNESRALGAEKVSTISSLLSTNFRAEARALQRLWTQIVLADEHTWNSADSGSDPEGEQSMRQGAEKRRAIENSKANIDDILLRGLAVLAHSVKTEAGDFIVFNALSWQRSALVEFALSKNQQIVDPSTGHLVNWQVVAPGTSTERVRFLAAAVPPFGYKRYQLRPREGGVAKAGPTEALENAFYRVKLDARRGAVLSIFDKQLSTELVDPSSPYRFNQYLYTTGGDRTPNRILQYSPIIDAPGLEIHPSGEGQLLSIDRLPFGTVAHLRSRAINTPTIDSDILLFDDEKKIEFVNRIEKNKVYTKEGVYFAFPFAIDNPAFEYDIQNGIVDPRKDQLPGAGSEWFSIQHWVAVKNSALSAALISADAPLITIGDVVRGAWPIIFGDRKSALFSYIMNNYWDTNYLAGQGGSFTFRYLLTSGRNLSPDALTRLGWEQRTPLEVGNVTSQDRAVGSSGWLPANQDSFLQLDQPNVILMTWKQAEDQDGSVWRFVETAGRETTFTVTVPRLSLRSAWTCDAMEIKRRALSVGGHLLQLRIKPFEILTVRLKGDPVSRTSRP